MTTFYVQWSAYGTATIEANTEEEAGNLASRALFGIDALDFRTNDVDGIEYNVGTEEP